MVEYGNGIGQVAGRAGGNGGGGTADLGAGASAFVSDAMHQISTMPPEMLLLIVVLILAGLFVLRRAF
jgi:hypothetical protein